jgi:glycine dehydrogenase subunit 2
MKEKIIFEYNSNSTAYVKPIAKTKFIDEKYLSDKSKNLPKTSEIDVARHFTNLSRQAYGVDTGMYPLGSCTMKYNPKINESIASSEILNNLHPYADENMSQGILEILYKSEYSLCQISGMDAVSLYPSAGADGEFTGLLVIEAYHRKNNDLKRDKILVPKSAHGTNPASASVLGKKVVEINTDETGCVDLKHLEEVLDDTVSCLMLTNPSTFGLFENNILKISKMIHDKGALMYYDGANLNPLLCSIRPRDMGFDVMHFNLHKTFSTPHGGGGPGSGPIGVVEKLKEFLPNPRVIKENNNYKLSFDSKNSIARIRPYFGNILVIVRAYVYILSLGYQGLKKAGDLSRLNANYLLKSVKHLFDYPFGDKMCWHEFVVSAKKFSKKNIKALDIAKRLIDYGVHPPTIYFPINIPEAMMFEPTETESKESLDNLVKILEKIVQEIETDPEFVHNSPHNTDIKRLDEVKAVKELDVVWR